jgi:predicted helicase
MSEDERFKLYLTNTLEMEEIEQIAIPGLSSLSEESHLAGMVKKEQPILVILGNPPYSGISANINAWTERLLKEDMDGAQSYYNVDGKPLDEKNPKWLQDDYVKFLRFAQWKIQTAGYGVVGMITNHSYLDNPTFRGMRQSLMKTFDEIYILDLHGNSLKKETTPEGGKDENVFDIRQGVAIAIFVRNQKPKKSKVYHANLYGLRKEKYEWLHEHKFTTKNYVKIHPQSPYYFLVQRDTEKINQYLKWMKINEIFPLNSVGIVTARDQFVIDFNKRDLKNRILQFKNLSQPDNLVSQAFNLKDKSNWKIIKARKTIADSDNIYEYIKSILYRPFDIRHIFYHPAVIERMRFEVMHHMLDENIGIVTRRQQLTDKLCNYFYISKSLIADGLIRSDNKGSESLFPLYIYPKEKKKNPGHGISTMLLFEPKVKYGRKPNIAPLVFEKLEITYKKKPSPEEILYYIYGIFYSNIFRETYAEFLKIDFPRVPFTADYQLFQAIGKLGKALADLHLLKSPALDPPVAKYQGNGNNDRIEKISYQENEKRIYINNDKYFEGVAPDVWRYHIGGYQVLYKYLKDRKNRIMDDAPRYCRIVTALQKTIKIQNEIDKVYPEVETSLINF